MELFIYAATLIVGIIVWAVRLEGRINTADQKHLDLKELIEAKFEGLDNRLERIERALNGALRRE